MEAVWVKEREDTELESKFGLIYPTPIIRTVNGALSENRFVEQKTLGLIKQPDLIKEAA